jgi:hypothetical protein
MRFNEYLNLLGEIDVAIFAHRRQQAMGNTISLLGLGKKVFMRNDVTPWGVFQKTGVKVYDIEKFEISSISDSIRMQNKANIRSYFSKVNLILQWREIASDQSSHLS